MRIINPEFSYDRFFQRLKSAQRRVLMLDYDGTLAPFQVQRNQAIPYSGVPELLNRFLKAQHTRVVIISGRYTGDLMPLLGLRRRPEIWGCHGIERLKSDGSYEVADLDQRTLETLRKAESWLQELGFGERCEQKPGGLAVHWRDLPPEQAKKLRDRIVSKWHLAAQNVGLSLKEFDGGIEIRTEAINKGQAVNTILSEMPDDTVAAYLGDDLTDEDAFRAIKHRGIGVLVRKEFRPTAADLWLQPPQELLEFLRKWHTSSSLSR